MGALDVAISGQERATKVVLTTVHSEFLRVAVSVVARLSLKYNCSGGVSVVHSHSRCTPHRLHDLSPTDSLSVPLSQIQHMMFL